MEINKPVATIIITIINVILVFLFAVPKYHQAQALDNKVAVTQAELNSESAYYAALEGLAADIDERESELEKIQSALPASFSLAPVMDFLQRKGMESGLVVKSITFSQSAAATTPQGRQPVVEEGLGPIKKISINLYFIGTYQGLKSFISSLEKSARLFEVDVISFAASQGQGIARSQSKIKTYEFKLKLVTNTY